MLFRRTMITESTQVWQSGLHLTVLMHSLTIFREWDRRHTTIYVNSTLRIRILLFSVTVWTRTEHEAFGKIELQIKWLDWVAFEWRKVRGEPTAWLIKHEVTKRATPTKMRQLRLCTASTLDLVVKLFDITRFAHTWLQHESVVKLVIRWAPIYIAGGKCGAIFLQLLLQKGCNSLPALRGVGVCAVADFIRKP